MILHDKNSVTPRQTGVLQMAFDFLSGDSLSDMNYILRVLFPPSQLNENPAWSKTVINTIQEGYVATGSRSENLHLPMTLKLDPEGHVTEFEQSDLDIMHIACVEPVILDPKNCHPGYVRLKSDRVGRENQFLHAGRFMEQHSGKFNLSHGPAAVSIKVLGEQDYVVCTKIKEWPSLTEKWLVRHRPSGWPNQEIINEIQDQGCLIVPIAHVKSRLPAFEWRLSFSLAEITLAKTLNDTQRNCYKILKMAFSAELKNPKGLCSYHLKNILFWACEQIPCEYWTNENVAACVLSLLDYLISYLASRNLPHYFLPDNNLIGHMESGAIQTLAVKATAIRCNPLKHLIKCRDNQPFFTGPFSTTLQSILNREHLNSDTGKYIEAGLEMATLYIEDATVCYYLATNMLQCNGKIYKLNSIQHHAETVLQPLLCALDVLEVVDTFAFERTYETLCTTSALTEGILKHCRIFHGVDSCPYQDDHVTSAIKGGVSAKLKELAVILSDQIASCGSSLQMSTSCLLDNAKDLLSLVFAYMLIFIHCDVDGAWYQHLAQLKAVRSELLQQKHTRYLSCVSQVLATAHFRIKDTSKLNLTRSTLPKQSPAFSIYERILNEQHRQCSKKQAESQKSEYKQYMGLVQGTIYGSSFELPLDSGDLSHKYGWELMYFGKFIMLPSTNAFKKAFGNLAEKCCREGIEHPGNDTAKKMSLRADYANLLQESGRYREALDILECVIQDVKSTEYDVCNSYAGYLKFVVLRDLLRGMSPSRNKRLVFHSLIYSYFFAVKCLVQLGDSGQAVTTVSRMENECDVIYQHTKSKVQWQVSANDYSLLGHAYRLCENRACSVLAFAFATWLREDLDQPRKSKNPEGMMSFRWPKDAQSSQVLIYTKVLWPEAEIPDILPCLAKTLYPHLHLMRSVVHIFHLIHADSHPSPSGIIPYLQCIASRMESTDRFVAAFEAFLRSLYPQAEPAERYKSFALEVRPNPECGLHESLYGYIKGLVHDPATLNIIMRDVTKLPVKTFTTDGYYVVAQYIHNFLGHLTLGEAVKVLMVDGVISDEGEELGECMDTITDQIDVYMEILRK